MHLMFTIIANEVLSMFIGPNTHRVYTMLILYMVFKGMVRSIQGWSQDYLIMGGYINNFAYRGAVNNKCNIYWANI